MKRLQIAEPVRDYSGFSHKWKLTFADFTSFAALTGTVTLLPASGFFPAGLMVLRAALKMTTPFTGGAISAVSADLGDPGSVARYLANANNDLFTALASNTKAQVVTNTPYVYQTSEVATNCKLQLKLTAVTANLSVLTAGAVEVYAQLVDINELAIPG